MGYQSGRHFLQGRTNVPERVVDVSVGCSQKGLMLPPGLGLNAVSRKGDLNGLMLSGTLCGVEMGLALAGVPFTKGSYKWSGGKAVTVFDSTVVAVETDSGVTGYGEVCPLGSFCIAGVARHDGGAGRRLPGGGVPPLSAQGGG